MTEEKQYVTGKVASINDWKSGKGVWVNLEGDPNDYFAYKNKAPKLGEEGTWQVKEGTGIFSDKVELVKKQAQAQAKEAHQKKTQEDFEDAAKIYLTKAEADAVRQNSIERQCALKAAANVVSNLSDPKGSYTIKNMTDTVLELAEPFRAWIQCEEPKLPEPPEEPDEPDTGE